MIVTFWDLGNHCEIAIIKERIVSFRPVASRQGTNIVVEGERMAVWVQESFEEVKKKLEASA